MRVFTWQVGRLQEALASYDALERLRAEQGLPPDPDLFVNKALVHYGLNNLELACRLAREAEQLYEKRGLPEPDGLTRFIAHACSGEAQSGVEIGER